MSYPQDHIFLKYRRQLAHAYSLEIQQPYKRWDKLAITFANAGLPLKNLRYSYKAPKIARRMIKDLINADITPTLMTLLDFLSKVPINLETLGINLTDQQKDDLIDMTLGELMFEYGQQSQFAKMDEDTISTEDTILTHVVLDLIRQNKEYNVKTILYRKNIFANKAEIVANIINTHPQYEEIDPNDIQDHCEKLTALIFQALPTRAICQEDKNGLMCYFSGKMEDYLEDYLDVPSPESSKLEPEP